MTEMIERVAKAIDAVHLFSRFNDWTSDRVPGCPIEICRYGEGDDEDDIVVVARFGGAISESEALADTVGKARARAAILAMRNPTDAMVLVGAEYHHDNWRPTHAREDTSAEAIWQDMLDAALVEPQP